MKFISAALLFVFLFPNLSGTSRSAVSASSAPLFGFRNSSDEMAREIRFMVVPDPKLAEEHLRILTQAPHMAGTPEDKATADYVAQKFRDAGLETEIMEYRVWMKISGFASTTLSRSSLPLSGPTIRAANSSAASVFPRVSLATGVAVAVATAALDTGCLSACTSVASDSIVFWRAATLPLASVSCRSRSAMRWSRSCPSAKVGIIPARHRNSDICFMQPLPPRP